MIRSFESPDIGSIMQIWYESNVKSHYFIAEEYWRSNFETVKSAIMQAEVYVYESDGEILGFIGLTDDYIAGIFVREDSRSKGIGRELLSCAKAKHNSLSLHVYRRNEGAAEFYKRENFELESVLTDKETGEEELLMSWKRL